MMKSIVFGSKLRYMMVGLALAGSAFFGACTPNGGGSVNNTQNNQPAVEEKGSSSLNNFNNVKEPSESAEKERQEQESGQEGNEAGESSGK